MTKDELIDKYNRIRNELNENHSTSRRLRHASEDPKEKADHEADQESYASQKYQVDRFLEDLHQLNVQDSLYSASR